MATSNQQYSSVKPFDGNNYSNWEFRIKLLLEQTSVLDVLKVNPPADAIELAEFNKKDAKARNIIVQCISDNMLEIIKQKTTAKEIMESLERIYLKKGISTQVQLQRKLRALKYTEQNSLTTFLTEFDQVVCELKAAGGAVEENEMICQLLSTMPDSYQVVTTAIDVMFCQDETKVSLNFVKNKLLMEESRQLKSTTAEVQDVAFSGYKNWNRRGRGGYRGSYRGHGSGSSNDRGNFPFKCHFCGEIGHMRKNCPKNNNGYGKRQPNVTEKQSMSTEEEGISFLTENTKDEGTGLVSLEHDRQEIRFVVDSGATHHLLKIDFLEAVSNKKEVKHKISVAKKGQNLNVIKEGDLRVNSESGRQVTIKNVWICEDLSHNLLSVRKLEEAGFEVIFKNNEVLIKKENNLILQGKRYGNLYTVIFRISPVGNANVTTTQNQTLLHRRIGHSSKYLSPEMCEICLKGKQTRLPFKTLNEERKAKRLLEVISSDVCGPISPPTYDGKRYYVTFLDHFSHFCVCYLIANKNEVFEKFVEYVNYVEAKFNTKIERFRCDNGGEYTPQVFRKF